MYHHIIISYHNVHFGGASSKTPASRPLNKQVSFQQCCECSRGQCRITNASWQAVPDAWNNVLVPAFSWQPSKIPGLTDTTTHHIRQISTKWLSDLCERTTSKIFRGHKVTKHATVRKLIFLTKQKLSKVEKREDRQINDLAPAALLGYIRPEYSGVMYDIIDIRMLNHCMEWYKWVLNERTYPTPDSSSTHLFYGRGRS